MVAKKHDDAALIDDFNNAFNLLEAELRRLVSLYEEYPMPIWVHRGTDTPMHWLASALQDIWYKDGQAGNESTPYVGLVGARPEHVRAIHAVNEAKHAFQLSGKMLKKAAPRSFEHAKSLFGHERRNAQSLLNQAGLARLHTKQAWRQLPLAEEPVRRVHFSWYSSGRTIKRMTVAEVDRALCRFDTSAPHIQIQRQTLSSLPSNEVLAQVKPQNSVVRANLTHFYPLPSLKIHVAMNLGMPLFVPLTEGQGLPEHNEPTLFPPAERSWPKRRDARLEEAPLFPSVHVHRYTT